MDEIYLHLQPRMQRAAIAASLIQSTSLGSLQSQQPQMMMDQKHPSILSLL